MSTIDSLGICGIRSYSSNRLEKIKFFHPVTLILGKNGSGKTTILECLKYGISGILPPNSQKGKFFIRDPEMDNKTEIKSVVNLVFKAINGKPILCGRSMSFGRTTQKETFRRIEQYLKIRRKEGDETIGHSCAEIDKQVPDLIGLTKAVIENVVLCHQESSDWPFSDKINLKNIFDDLFNTTVVSKYIETCKSDQNKKKKKIQQLQMETKLQEKDFNDYIEYLKKFEENHDKYNSFTKEIEEYEKILVKLEHYQDLTNLEREIGKFETKFSALKEDFNLIDLEIKLLEKENLIPDIEEEQLFNEIDKLVKKIENYKKELDSIENDKDGQNVYFLQKSISDFSFKYYYTEKKYDFYNSQNIVIALEEVLKEKNKLLDNLSLIKEEKKSIENNLKEKSEFFKIKLQKLEEDQKKIKKMKEIEKAQNLKKEINQIEKEQEEFNNQKSSFIKKIETDKIKVEYLIKKELFLKNCLMKKSFIEKETEMLKLEEILQIKNNEEISQIEKFIKEDLKKLEELNEKLRNSQKNLSNTLATEEIQRNERNKLLQTRIFYEKKLRENNINIEEDNPFEKYKNTKTEIKQLLKQKYELENSISFLKGFEENLMQKKKCGICATNLKEKEIKKTLEKLKRKILKIEEILKIDEDNINTLEIEIQNKSKLKKELRDFDYLSQNILELNEKIINSGALKISQEKDIIDFSQQFENLKSRIQNLESLIKIKKDLIRFDVSKIEDNLKIPEDLKESDIKNAAEEQNKIHEILRNNYSLLSKIDRNILENNTVLFQKNEELRKMGINIEKEAINENLQKIDFENEIKLTQTQYCEEEKKIKKQEEKMEKKNDNLNKKRNYIEQLEEKLTEYIKYFDNSQVLVKKKILSEKIEKKNTELKNLKKKEEILKKSEIRKNLEKKIKKVDDKKKECLKKEKELLDKKKEFDEIKNKINNLKGQIKVIAKNMENFLRLIKTKEKSELTYIKAMTNLKTSQLILDDIKKFSKLLEKSLIEHHISKIKQINKIISKIWQQVYSGNDIKTIKIKSEVVDTCEKSNKKNYNYGIFFLDKDEKELEMKGRCSAGQRVLASIVIRLALSQAFCTHSGLLALDEPTTNLDEKNIYLLANFLKKLIEYKKEQNNFQLIIITHDKEFLQMLSSDVEDYYEVYKDDSGYSTIRLKEFHC